MLPSHTSRLKRAKRVRSRLSGTKARPRLSVFRSNKHIYAQLIDDERGITLAQSSDEGETTGAKKERAYQVGIHLAKKAQKMRIKKAIFDRGGYKFQGRVSELARGAKEGGIKF